MAPMTHSSAGAAATEWISIRTNPCQRRRHVRTSMDEVGFEHEPKMADRAALVIPPGLLAQSRGLEWCTREPTDGWGSNARNYHPRGPTP
jgi:hypothetical protein